jgi:hypothetical protein
MTVMDQLDIPADVLDDVALVPVSICIPEVDAKVLGGTAVVQMSLKLMGTFQEDGDLISFYTSSESSKLQNEWTLFWMCTRTRVQRHRPKREGVVAPAGLYYHLPNCLANGGAFCGTMTTKRIS